MKTLAVICLLMFSTVSLGAPFMTWEEYHQEHLKKEAVDYNKRYDTVTYGGKDYVAYVVQDNSKGTVVILGTETTTVDYKIKFVQTVTLSGQYAGIAGDDCSGFTLLGKCYSIGG